MKKRDWPALARALGEVFLRNRLHPAVLARIEQMGASTPWALACSGGADSLCMVLLLFAHFPDYRKNMHIFHFNHLLRGAESDEDEVFVRDLAEGLGLKFHSARWDHPPQKASGAGPAREARFQFFSDAMIKIGSEILFLGHQLEDVAESILLRAGRGSGAGGLAAPRPAHIFRTGKVHLRPLLEVGKKEITEALTEAGIEWREDASNRSGKFTRNRLRRDVLPVWQEAMPQDVLKGAARVRALAEEDDDALEQWLESLLTQGKKSRELDLRPLLSKPSALWRRAFHRFLIINSLETTFSAREIDRWVSDLALNRDKSSSAGKTGFIEFREGRLLFFNRPNAAADWPPVRIPVGATLYWPDSGELMIETLTISLKQRKAILGGKIDQRRQACLEAGDGKMTHLKVRRWKTGDRYRPLGAPGGRKLQDMFTDRKILALERKKLPVVCDDEGDILWVPGLPPADAFKITGNTVLSIRLTYAQPSTA